ncbi:hypothetical protein [Allocoleopsis sp.]|uniref:hypothetical protein n=1 Tax=Allocoleopsis sp. TaxID=3088169 RepID=UPI002FD765F3
MTSTIGDRGRTMNSTLITDEIPNFNEAHIDFIETTPLPQSHQIKERWRGAIANLEQQNIGWLDILSVMANIAEQQWDEQLVEVPKPLTRQLKRHRKVLRDL